MEVVHEKFGRLDALRSATPANAADICHWSILAISAIAFQAAAFLSPHASKAIGKVAVIATARTARNPTKSTHI